MKFETLDLDPRLIKGIREKEYTDMTEVQARTLPQTLQGLDVAVQSQTGSGKTAAFLITLFEHLSKGRSGHLLTSLIVVPTRELAVQIEKEAILLNRHLGFNIGSFYGGVGYSSQLTKLKCGIDIVIGTPGRLLDLSRKGHLNLKKIGILVIDEADRLFDMGFLPDIKKLLNMMPPRTLRQNMLFSATLNRFSRTLAAQHMNTPQFIEISPEQITVETIHQELYHVKSHIKMNLMLGILKAESPQNALIFSNTRHAAFRLSQRMRTNGFQCQHLTGDLPQKERLKIIEDFIAGKFSYLVATDVAARGLHIEGLEMVINYDLPQDCENYVHRIGRTARAGKSGKAISLASEGMAGHLDAIESFIGMNIPVQDADIDLFARDLSCTGYRPEYSSRKGHPPRGSHSRSRRKSGQVKRLRHHRVDR